MKYIKLFEDYSETGDKPSEITVRVTPEFVKEFKLERNDISVSALPGESGVRLPKDQTKFIGFTPRHEDWWAEQPTDDGRVRSRKVNISDVFWFAKYNPVIGEVLLQGVHTESSGKNLSGDLLDTISRNPDANVEHFIKYGEGKEDMKMYRNLNCIFRGRFKEGSLDQDGYLELVSFK
jgi:hypothetical protein